MRLGYIERVPAHMRNFQFGIVRRDAVDIAPDPAETFRDCMLATALAHQLHADADAEEGSAAAPHALVERLHHAVDSIEAAPAVGKSADAGEHHAVRARHLVGIAGDDDGL